MVRKIDKIESKQPQELWPYLTKRSKGYEAIYEYED